MCLSSSAESKRAGLGASVARAGDHQGEAELAPFMVRLQVFSQKLGYSIQAKNHPLAAFSLDELEGTAGEIEREVPSHDGQPIAVLCRSLLRVAIERLEGEMATGSWCERHAAYEVLIGNYNACHQATAHAFIRILPARGQPGFDQDFSLAPSAAPGR